MAEAQVKAQKELARYNAACARRAAQGEPLLDAVRGRLALYRDLQRAAIDGDVATAHDLHFQLVRDSDPLRGAEHVLAATGGDWGVGAAGRQFMDLERKCFSQLAEPLEALTTETAPTRSTLLEVGLLIREVLSPLGAATGDVQAAVDAYVVEDHDQALRLVNQIGGRTLAEMRRRTNDQGSADTR